MGQPNGTQARNWKLSNEKLYLRQQVSKVLDLVKREDFADYVFFASAANTALRISEILHLKAEDVGPGQIMVVRRKKKDLKAEPLQVGPEFERLIRKLASKIGDGWLWTGRSKGCRRPRQKDGRVYATEEICQGGHLCKREIQRRWSDYVARSGLTQPGRGAHGLRHYAITEFYKVHRDLRAAQEFAGHSSSTITETYAHVVDMAEKVRAVKAVL